MASNGGAAAPALQMGRTEAALLAVCVVVCALVVRNGSQPQYPGSLPQIAGRVSPEYAAASAVVGIAAYVLSKCTRFPLRRLFPVDPESFDLPRKGPRTGGHTRE